MTQESQASSQYSIASFAIIYNDLRAVLLSLRRDRDTWNLPGGRLERGELPNETVQREVKEETGLEVAIEKLTGVYAQQDKYELVFVFICKIVAGQLTPSDEASQHQFYPIDSLPKNTIEYHIDKILDAKKTDQQPIFSR